MVENLIILVKFNYFSKTNYYKFHDRTMGWADRRNLTQYDFT